VNYEYPPIGGGGGNATLHIAREFARLGHKPFVLTAAWSDLPASEDKDGVVVQRIPALRQNADRCSIPEMLAFMASALLSAPGWARRWNIEFTIIFFTLPCGPIGWLLKRLLKTPYAISLQGGDVPGFDPQTLGTYHALSGPVIRHLWHDAAAVVANAQGLADLGRRFDARTKIPVIPAGADVNSIAPKSDYASQDAIKLLFVGRLVHQKGLDILLKALGKLDPELNWNMTFVGQGPEHAALTSQAQHLGIMDRMTFKSWTDKAMLPGIYKNADIFVLPSRDEGMANALLEAMAAGLPVVGTDISGTREVVVQGETGLTVPAESVDELSAALAAMILDQNKREVFGRAARARVEARFSWTSAATQWLNVVEESLGKVS